MKHYTVYFIWKLPYMFRVVPPPIIRSANNYLQHLVFVTPLLLPATPDDGWWHHPKQVEQFPNKINCVMLHLVGYILEYYTMHGPMNVKNLKFTSCPKEQTHHIHYKDQPVVMYSPAVCL